MYTNQDIRKGYQALKLSYSADAIKRLSNSLFGKFLEVRARIFKLFRTSNERTNERTNVCRSKSTSRNATFTLSLILRFQNPRKRQVISFVTERAKYTKLANKANFMGRKIISENCVLVKNKQTKICFDKPLFVGNNFVNRVGQKRKI